MVSQRAQRETTGDTLEFGGHASKEPEAAQGEQEAQGTKRGTLEPR